MATGDAKLRVQNIVYWGTAGCGRKRGRKVDDAFERQILDELIFTTLEKVDSEEKAVAVANVCYSYAIILMAAQKVQQKPEWKENPKVNKLKFRRTWIRGWLRRCALRKRRITTQAKNLPPPEKVQERMGEIQKKIIDGAFSPEDIFSGDETGVCCSVRRL